MFNRLSVTWVITKVISRFPKGFANSVLSLPMHTELDEEQLKYITGQHY